jgi:hypothetical protein
MNESNPLFVAGLVLLPIVIMPAFWCLVVLLISSVSGWRRLSRDYAASFPPHGQAFLSQTGKVGPSSYRNSLHVHVAPEGLFLSVPFVFRLGHKPLLIPWHEIHSQEPATFRRLDMIRFEVGYPSKARIQLPHAILEASPNPR